MMFSNKDLQQIASHGLDAQTAEKQICNFKKGFPPLNVVRPALVGDGIVKLTENEVEKLADAYTSLAKNKKIVKFIPASGAATRMFKELFEYISDDLKTASIDEVVNKLDKFAFGENVKEITNRGSDPKGIISSVISKDGLNYGQAPKALILFHKYKEGNRTAMEEHLAEGAMYAKSGDGVVKLHFTVSAEHLAGFESLVKKVLPYYESKYGVKYDIGYSQQKPSTDTIAAALDNEPFREEDGSLLFRPAGHGALLENLGDIDADIIFIKTIDNVAPDSLKADTVKYKKALGAMMLSLQSQIFGYLRTLDAGEADKKLIGEIAEFIENKIAFKLNPVFYSMDFAEQKDVIYKILNRPIRVCGMVKNEGEPGGGPFWVEDRHGNESLQIGEPSQLSPRQKHLINEGTHFNPVDLVCGTQNYKGEKFDLKNYTDPDTGFISLKSKNGRDLKAQELPGLWNGAMARWNTIFVEVPITTFSPVKTVNDLLRKEHQEN